MESVSSAWNSMKDAAGSLGTTISDAVSKVREKLTGQTGQPPPTGPSIQPVLGGRRSRKGKRRNKNKKSKKYKRFF